MQQAERKLEKEDLDSQTYGDGAGDQYHQLFGSFGQKASKVQERPNKKIWNLRIDSVRTKKLNYSKVWTKPTCSSGPARFQFNGRSVNLEKLKQLFLQTLV